MLIIGYGWCFCTWSWVLGHGSSLNYSSVWCSVLKITFKLHFLDSLYRFWCLEVWKEDSKIRQSQLLKGFFLYISSSFLWRHEGSICICYQKRLFIHSKELSKSLHVQGWVKAILSRIKHTENLIHYVQIERIKVIAKILKLWCL